MPDQARHYSSHDQFCGDDISERRERSANISACGTGSSRISRTQAQSSARNHCRKCWNLWYPSRRRSGMRPGSIERAAARVCGIPWPARYSPLNSSSRCPRRTARVRAVRGRDIRDPSESRAAEAYDVQSLTRRRWCPRDVPEAPGEMVLQKRRPNGQLGRLNRSAPEILDEVPGKRARIDCCGLAADNRTPKIVLTSMQADPSTHRQPNRGLWP